MPTKEEAEDTDLEQVNQMVNEKSKTIQADSLPPDSGPDSSTYRDEGPPQSSAHGPTAARTAVTIPAGGNNSRVRRGSGLASSIPPDFRAKLPFSWLTIGIVIAATLAVALSWSTCHQPPPDPASLH